MPIALLLLLGAIGVGLGALPSRADPVGILAPWSGEYFDTRQGGFFLRVGLKGFKAGKTSALVTTDARLVVWDILGRKALAASIAVSERGPPGVIWKVPAGKYEVREIAFVDGSGAKRTWKPPADRKGRRHFVVKRQCLSNLGQWTLAPEGGTDLTLAVETIANPYKEEGNRKESSVAAVLDGFTGELQERFAGKAAREGADDTYSSGRELRANLTFTRQISMFFALNLFKHNFRARPVADALNVADGNLRRCYTDRLEWREGLKGTVAFTFLLSKETGSMSKIRHTGGTAQDGKLVECLQREMSGMDFPVPEPMIGELTYTFDVK